MAGIADFLFPTQQQAPVAPDTPIDLTNQQPLVQQPFTQEQLRQAAAPQPSMADTIGEKAGGAWDSFKTWMSDPHNANRLALLSAALLTPGTNADKLQLAALSQTAYGNISANATRQQGIEDEKNKVDNAYKVAQTEGTQAATERTKALTPGEVQKQTLDINQKQLDLDEAKKAADALEKIDPAGAKRARLKIDKEQSALDLQKAQAGEANARSAEISNTSKAQTTVMDPNATAEQKDAATTVLSRGKSAQQQKKDHLVQMQNLYKQANPGATDQEAAQYALDAESGMKGEELRAAALLAQNSMPNSPEYEAAMAVIKKHTVKGAGRGDGTTTPSAGKTASEADITATMKANNLSRAEVLSKLKAKGFNVPEK